MKTYIKPTSLVVDIYYSDNMCQPELHVGSNFNPDEQEILVREYNDFDEYSDDPTILTNSKTSNMWDDKW